MRQKCKHIRFKSVQKCTNVNYIEIKVYKCKPKCKRMRQKCKHIRFKSVQKCTNVNYNEIKVYKCKPKM